MGKALKKNDSKGFEYYRLASDQGHTKATRNLGTCYFRGYGVKPDIKKGLELWKKAADSGDSDAMFNFGHSYYTGESSAPINKALGAEYLRKSAENGNAMAVQFVLAQGL